MSLPPEATSALLQIHDRDGYLSPSAVVAEAADPASALHAYFEWDDTDAAEQFRLIQAGRLIKRVRIRFEPAVSVSEVKTARVVTAFYNVAPPTDPAEYRSIRDIVRDPDLEAAAERRARADLCRVERKYRDLTRLVDVVREVFKLEESA